jgi:ubiquinone biosynthesis protein UbiJ
LITTVASIFGILAIPFGIQLWLIDKFNDHANESLTRIETEAESKVERTVNDLTQKAISKSSSAFPPAAIIDDIRSDVEALNQQIDSLTKELESVKAKEAQLPKDPTKESSSTTLSPPSK